MLRSLLPDHIYTSAILLILMVTPVLVGIMHVEDLRVYHLDIAAVWLGSMAVVALICAQRTDSSKGLFRPLNPQLIVVVGSMLAVLSGVVNSVATFGPFTVDPVTPIVIAGVTGLGAIVTALVKKNADEQ